jgi:hypothetical protein
MGQVWIITAVYGRCGNLMFDSRNQAKKWIYEHFTRNTIIEDNIKPAKLYLDTPEKLDKV